MAKLPRAKPIQIGPAFTKISAQIEPQTDPKLGNFLIQLVKNPDEFKRFTANPAAALTAHKIDAKLVNVAAVQALAQSVISRIAGLGKGPTVMDAVSNSETSQSQDRNFDNSASWFTNKDGYNVIFDAGHSSEQSTGQQVGQDKNFSGLTTQPGDVFQNELNTVFFPGQPLVTPTLVAKIKAAVRGGTT
jgi:hypothetical protein